MKGSEVPTLHWQKSSYSSEGNNCLELATASDGTIRLRESDEPAVTLTLPTRSLKYLIGIACENPLPASKA
ncbi:DUF397 domain-containing protein [Streptomyces sp. NPDC060223]|uniref:DUF397 domain-containing protein n=1 Tax=unclassified Streptomyces TaxID=2593676 RepID=UPI00363DA6C9